jgi:hypothetical protein
LIAQEVTGMKTVTGKGVLPLGAALLKAHANNAHHY